MRKITAIIVLAFSAAADAEGMSTTQIGDVQDFIAKLVDKLTDSLVETLFSQAQKAAPLQDAVLDNMTFGKSGSIATLPGSGPISLLVKAPFYRNFPAHSGLYDGSAATPWADYWQPSHRETTLRRAVETLDDRQALPALPLPELQQPKRVVIVRHGQSTWNAEGRIQGSTDHSVLTEKGQDQARITAKILEKEAFDVLIHSPLKRASETAEIIWGSHRPSNATILNTLREIDLYGFEGLLKHEGIDKYGDKWRDWQTRASAFNIDEHYPVQELWYRASLGWRQILDIDARNVLVVAHNAVNQALIATSLGLSYSYFRRMLQSNGAITVLDLVPTLDGNRVTVDRLNQSPFSPVVKGQGAGRSSAARLILVRHAATDSTGKGLLLGCSDSETANPKGEREMMHVAEMLHAVKAHKIFSSPLARCIETAKAIQSSQEHNESAPAPSVEVLAKLTNLHIDSWEGKPAREIRRLSSPEYAEPLHKFWDRARQVWSQLKREASDGGGQDIVVVTHGAMIAALFAAALNLGESAISKFRFGTGSISVIEFPDGALVGPGVVRCSNFKTESDDATVQDDETFEDVCGIDGCF